MLAGAADARRRLCVRSSTGHCCISIPPASPLKPSTGTCAEYIMNESTPVHRLPKSSSGSAIPVSANALTSGKCWASKAQKNNRCLSPTSSYIASCRSRSV
ncbi:hypothetical protein CDAR_464101 [Caerostris darwini]|uniref:Uncharacterized protein n=1 Tax=Caerostris darwini TaxID=1538125 RepID=A0AAV4VVE8_9ARAC|nr:hypothetical protein CDAR_464101 [Caerostris darwini]